MENKYKDKIITIPNILSLVRLLLIPLFVWLYTSEKNYVASIWVLVISGLTDTIDGYIARKYNMISDFGKMLDPLADKLTQAVVLGCLVTRFPNMIYPLVLLVIKEIIALITGLMLIKKTNVVNGAKWHGKVATILLYITMIVHVVWFNIPDRISNILIFACLAIMVVSFYLYTSHNIRELMKKEINT